MIILLIGQPNSGKTTLAKMLLEVLSEYNWLDGDSIRKLTKNFDYSPKGRLKNIEFITNYCLNNKNVIVSSIMPIKNYREILKNETNCVEIYLKSKRLRKNYYCNIFEKPVNPNIIIDTDLLNEGESFDIILKYIKCYG